MGVDGWMCEWMDGWTDRWMEDRREEGCGLEEETWRPVAGSQDCCDGPAGRGRGPEVIRAQGGVEGGRS